MDEEAGYGLVLQGVSAQPALQQWQWAMSGWSHLRT